MPQTKKIAKLPWVTIEIHSRTEDFFSFLKYSSNSPNSSFLFIIPSRLPLDYGSVVVVQFPGFINLLLLSSPASPRPGSDCLPPPLAREFLLFVLKVDWNLYRPQSPVTPLTGDYGNSILYHFLKKLSPF